MKRLGLHEVRTEYLNFFESKKHLVVPSFSLVPQNDKSLLLIGAGMAPLKKYFTGELVPPATRMASCQKCIRTGDIENVGKTDRHATFFEMLGNFSFGDYFKVEAVEWAWEFLTVNLEIEKEKLWVTVFHEDDEAFDIWEQKIGVPPEKIVRLGKEDNFWELEVGPSGPCSEIFVDRGEEYGCGDPNCKPGCECDRFIEVWNLVFTQFDKDEQGVYHRLSNPNIDTGMGLERMATVLEGANNIFEIEAIKDIIRKIEEVANYKYGSDEQKDVSVRVITDHVRAMTFLVSDSVIPSNEGRGYVLRRLMRRAARHGKLLGIKGEFLSEVAQVVIDSWGKEYTELVEKQDMIKSVIINEEEKFSETIEQGIHILENYIVELEANSETVLSGEKAFKLSDTYGFPIDLTKEILSEKGLLVNEEEYEAELKAQRDRARAARDDGDNIGWHSQNTDDLNLEPTEFLGYSETSADAKVVMLMLDNEEVSSLSAGDTGVIILDRTPFYGESGGQKGDTGVIRNDNFEAEVLDTRKVGKEVFFHIVKVNSGSIEKEASVNAEINRRMRNDIVRNHTATHLLHKALKVVLGEHVNQAGSEIHPNRFRFDFSHFQAVSKEDLAKIERLVNEYIYSDTDTVIYELPVSEAFSSGAIGLFENKYSDMVRIVEIPGISKELCGGTHVGNTSEIGMFKILSESGIASGTRRIEAITGMHVYEHMLNLEDRENEVVSVLKATRDTIIDRAKTLLDDNKNLNKSLEDMKVQSLNSEIDEILANKEVVGSVNLITHKFEGVDVDNLRNLADQLRDKTENAIIVLATVNDDKLNFVSAVDKNLVKEGFSAGNIIREVAKVTGGGGGGRPDMATAGGKDITKVESALRTVKDLIRK
ncbi:MAG: alanine--tRNA ligase [Tissierellia bacterium]|nr:alanine--tRNA ligase [Tissierellia bacterium]